VTGVDTSQSGFVANTTQVSTTQSGKGSLHGNRIAEAERQLAGEFIDPNIGLPYLNEAGPVGATDWEITPREVTGIINFEQDSDGDGVAGPAGNFREPDYPDAPIPGIPGWNDSYDGIVVEFLTFLELKAGFHTLGVNSDDGFQVTSGPSVKDLFGITLGQFDGGRGAADTLFNVLVKEDGFYPVRLLYFEGTGGASVEFFSVVDGVKIPINATDPQAIKAYRSGPVRPYITRAVTPDGSLGSLIEVDVTDGDVSLVEGSVTLTVDGADVSPTVTKADGVTTISYDHGGPFAGGEHVAVLSYDESSTPTVTRTVTLNFRVPKGQLVVLEDGPFAYWRLGEKEGTAAYSEVGVGLTGTYMNNPKLGEPRLVVGDPSTSVLFDKALTNYVVIPNHRDLNILPSGAAPWKYKTIELWFKARHLPTNDPLGDGSAAGLTQSQILYEEGGVTRGITIYLRGTQPGPEPSEAELWVNALNRAEQVWGGTLPHEPKKANGDVLTPNSDPVAIHTTIEAGKLYHLVFVMKGDDSADDSFNGTLKGYLNGVKFDETTGVHLMYNHTDPVALGARNSEFAFHDYLSNATWNPDFWAEGNLLPFDGWIDEVALYNIPLSEERIQVHYQAGMTEVPPEGGDQGITGFELVDGVLHIEYTGTRTEAASVTGPYEPVPDATSPYAAPATEAAQFFIAE
jgi:hypothetical protein